VPSAPIASPPINQTPPPLALPPARPGLTRRFDDLFRTHGQGIPVAYLRALANAESSMRADDRLGLINVVKVALDDYNRRRRMAITPEQMRDPAINVRVAADTLRMIIDSYRVNHADVDNLREDWRNPRFVELLTTGWNAGYSEIGGVGRVVRWLQQRPIAERAPITIDAVFDAAWSAGATRHLSNPRKLTWAKGVAKAYERERERDQRDRIA
jgi:soluble lytic murein transglycosylase-like protein